MGALHRRIETDGPLDAATQEGFGGIGFTALAQGLLTGRHLDGIPADSRATQGKSFDEGRLSDGMPRLPRALNNIAAGRGQSLAQRARPATGRLAPPPPLRASTHPRLHGGFWYGPDTVPSLSSAQPE